MDIVQIILNSARVAKVNGALLLALCSHESGNFKQTFVAMDNGSPSFGVCQIKYHTALQLGFHGLPHQLMDPKTNANFAASYLRYQQQRYGSSWIKLVAAYNAGSYLPNKATGCPRNLRYVKLVQKKLPVDLRDRLNCDSKKVTETP
jgi:soluble lytic murein transglycosylase-like protein